MGLRITIAPQDNDGKVIGAAVTLCDSPDPLSHHDLRINGKPVLQVVQAVRALYPTIFNRGNRAITMSFGTFRNSGVDGVAFRGPAAALGFAFDACAFDEILPHYGFVTIEASDGSQSVVRYLDRCGLESIDAPRIHGVGLWFSYQLIAGTPLRQAPVTTP